jgi:hypothetical protein
MELISFRKYLIKYLLNGKLDNFMSNSHLVREEKLVKPLFSDTLFKCKLF